MEDSAAMEPNGDKKPASAPSYMEEDDDELFNLLQEDGEKAVKFVNNPYSLGFSVFFFLRHH
jgi:hypothetical protein